MIVASVFLVTMLAHPLAGVSWAQAPEGKSVVLFTPVQSSEDVPEGVPGRIEEYLHALIEIDPKIDLVMHSVETVDEVVEEPVEPKPIRENPGLKKARKVLDSGKRAIEKKRFETGLRQVMYAESLYKRALGELEDFDQYVDARLWLAIGFIDGGFRDEGYAALRRLLVLRPDLTLTDKVFSNRFIKAMDSARGRLVKGGDLTVAVADGNASVYVDGRLAGQGAQTVSGMTAGRHFVRVTSAGFKPVGKFVQVRRAGSSSSVMLKLKPLSPDKTTAGPPEIDVKPLTGFAKTGEFTGSFKRYAGTAVTASKAGYALLGYVARSDSAFHFGLFLFDSRSGGTVAIEPAIIDTDLSNLQITLLDVETRLSKALERFPNDRLVTSRPGIYAISPSRMTGPAPVSEPAPVAEPEPPGPAPVTVATVEPEATPTGGFDEIPEDFPMSDWPEETTSKQWYEKWWVWTVVGVVVSVAVVGGVCGAGKCGSGGGRDEFGARAVW